MPDLNLSEIEARAAVATEGPWDVQPHWAAPGWEPNVTYTRIVSGEPNDISRIRHVVVSTDGALDGSPSRTEGDANAAFIAHARTDVPDLVAEVRRLCAELEEIQNSDWRGEDQ